MCTTTIIKQIIYTPLPCSFSKRTPNQAYHTQYDNLSTSIITIQKQDKKRKKGGKKDWQKKKLTTRHWQNIQKRHHISTSEDDKAARTSFSRLRLVVGRNTAVQFILLLFVCAAPQRGRGGAEVRGTGMRGGDGAKGTGFWGVVDVYFLHGWRGLVCVMWVCCGCVCLAGWVAGVAGVAG